MANEILIFDATGSNVDGTDPGTALTVGPGTSYKLRDGTTFPGPPLDVLYASSVDTEGELPASRRYGNRSLTIKLAMTDPTGSLLAALRQKFGKFQREGGTLKRTLKNGDVRIYDIVAADGWNPNYDWAYWRSDFTEVEMTLPARPLSRGVEVDLGDNVETTLPVLIFSDTNVSGDALGRVRLLIDNDVASAQQSLIFGMRSRYYSSASTAALFKEAEAFTMSAAATAVGTAGASGAGSNVAKQTNLSASFVTQIITGFSHIGTHNVYCRVLVPVSNTGTVSVRLRWYAQGGTFVNNDQVDIDPSWEGSWRILDLGQVSPGVVQKGPQAWQAEIQALSTVAGDDLELDCVFFVPVDEGWGLVTGDSTWAALLASESMEITSEYVLSSLTSGGSIWYPPVKFEGDYPRIPSSGLEGRTVEWIIKASRGEFTTGADSSIDDISARLFYTPRYLT